MSEREKDKDKRARNPVPLIRDLAALFSGTDLTEIEVEQDDLRIRVARQVHAAPQVSGMMMPMQYQQPAPQPAPSAAPAPEVPTASGPSEFAITSPMVGTVYLSSEPGAAPFVREGDAVSAGQTLLIIEAMKVMNNVPAPRSGVVRKIAVGDKQPVEYGQVLLDIV